MRLCEADAINRYCGIDPSSSAAFPVATLPPVQCMSDFHNVALNGQVLDAAAGR